MNIFRIIASGKHGMREEFVTAFLSYLLSPKMDHGLGYTFLSKLLNNISEINDVTPIKDLAGQFKSQLWENIFQENEDQPVVELEFKYPGGFIDIVIRCGNWFIMIENKIIQSSKKADQIKEQYQGLLDVLKSKEYQDDYHILLIYLVPAGRNGSMRSISTSFYEEIEKVSLREGDFKTLVSWQPVKDEENPVVSKVEILQDIIKHESEGLMTPVSTEVRHVLLSLIDFSLREFHGFHYEKATSKGPGYPKLKVSEILNLEGNYYIGIQYGRGGIASDAWRNPAFTNKALSVTEDSTRGWQYVPLKEFKIYAKWAMDPEHNRLQSVKWSGEPFGTKNLYRVAKFGKAQFYIGIKGGKNALKKMLPEKIREREKWKLLGNKKSEEWISTDDFCQILESVGISYD